jgi:hypothetical protein
MNLTSQLSLEHAANLNDFRTQGPLSIEQVLAAVAAQEPVWTNQLIAGDHRKQVHEIPSLKLLI